MLLNKCLVERKITDELMFACTRDYVCLCDKYMRRPTPGIESVVKVQKEADKISILYTNINSMAALLVINESLQSLCHQISLCTPCKEAFFIRLLLSPVRPHTHTHTHTHCKIC